MMLEALGISCVVVAPGLSVVLGSSGRGRRATAGILVAVVGWSFLWMGASRLSEASIVPGLWMGASRFSEASWVALILWSILGCGYSFFRIWMGEQKNFSWMHGVEEKKKMQKDLERQLSQIRQHGSRGEEEQKRALAIYGLVKSLSEALSWDSIKPKLESAMKRYLELEEFALYIAEMDSSEKMQPLIKRGLLGSVGAAWESLRDSLVHQRLSIQQAHIWPVPQAAVGVPIPHGSELVGYVFAKLPAGTQPEELLVKTQGFAEEISFALKRVRLFQEVERLSEVDGLTGVYRRNILEQKIKEETLRARTFKTTYCLMLLDIDHFKNLNDTYGHPFGDAVLKRLGEILKACVYETDFVARYGGEEFAVLLPRAEPIGVLRKAETIRSMVEKETFIQGLDTVHITVSIGVAHFPRDGQTPEEVVAQADQALYQAKAQGRNRIVDVNNSA
ncbi:MAG: GGDEF domain-containing protein [Elusimicrobia bacterium]|nr:GGDEF domain-containing protein [Elusimicrobiota bacterium]